jgi:hypothetical protein
MSYSARTKPNLGLLRQANKSTSTSYTWTTAPPPSSRIFYATSAMASTCLACSCLSGWLRVFSQSQSQPCLLWDLATTRETASRCRFCNLLIACIPHNLNLSSSDAYNICVTPELIAKHRDFGNRTIWNIITGRNSTPDFGHSIFGGQVCVAFGGNTLV